MPRIFIIATNCVLLIFLLIGLPAATRAQFGNWQVSSARTNRLLMFCGLGIAAAGNMFAARFFAKNRKQKILCWEWAMVFAGLFLAFYGFTHGYFNFDWLKHALLWLQNHF